jgi:hypothetical protein
MVVHREDVLNLVVNMALVVKVEEMIRSISRLKKKYFLMDMEQWDFSVGRKAPVVMVFEYYFVVVNSVITEHVVLPFVVEYHQNFGDLMENHLHAEVRLVLIQRFGMAEME